jgi:hypothetical protein
MNIKIFRKNLIFLFLILFLFGFLSPAFSNPRNIWHWRNSIPIGNPFSNVTYGNNTFVAVGQYGTILQSAPISDTKFH